MGIGQYASWSEARAAQQRAALAVVLLVQCTLVPLHILTTDYLDLETRFSWLSIGARFGAVAVFILLALGVWRLGWKPDIHAGVSFFVNALSDAYVSTFASSDVIVTHFLGYGVVLIGYALLLLMPPLLYISIMSVSTAALGYLIGSSPTISPIEALQKEGAFIIFFLVIGPVLAYLRYAFAKSEYENARRFVLLNEELTVTNEELAQSNAELQRVSEELRQRLYEIEIKDREITQSIEYAQRIQLAILPPAAQIETRLPHSFVLYRPSAIVSGDFYYYATPQEGLHIVVIGDATGHGVPGAFMSLIGLTLLNEALKNFSLPHPEGLLEEIDANLYALLHQGTLPTYRRHIRDSIDMALCVVDERAQMLHFCGAKRPLYQITPDMEVQVYKGALRSLGEEGRPEGPLQTPHPTFY